MLFLILESVVTDGGASEIWIIAGGGGLTEDLYGTFLSEDLSKSISPSAEKMVEISRCWCLGNRPCKL